MDVMHAGGEMNPTDILLTDQVAVVTGGGGGIGRAIALAFASAGADVVIGDILPERCEETAGKVLRRSIAAGTPLRTEWLEPARVVMRGDTVQVEIINGGAHLVLDGVAATSGAVGDSVLVINPDSKKQFRARVIAAGKVLVRGNL